MKARGERGEREASAPLVEVPKGVSQAGASPKGRWWPPQRGLVPSNSYALGDQILSYALDEDRIDVDMVRQVRSKTRSVGRLQSGDRELSVTDDHPLFELSSLDYLPAASLSAGASLLLLGAGWEAPNALAVASARQLSPRSLRGQYVELAGQAVVYDLTVARNENFFAQGVLVHNKSETICKSRPVFRVCESSAVDAFSIPGYIAAAPPDEASLGNGGASIHVGGSSGQAGAGGAAAGDGWFVVSFPSRQGSCGLLEAGIGAPTRLALHAAPATPFEIYRGSAPCALDEPLLEGRTQDNGTQPLGLDEALDDAPHVTVRVRVSPCNLISARLNDAVHQSYDTQHRWCTQIRDSATVVR